jgi:hypothetical protein
MYTVVLNLKYMKAPSEWFLKDSVNTNHKINFSGMPRCDWGKAETGHSLQH